MEPIESGKTKLTRVTEGQLNGLSKIFQPFLIRRTRRSSEEDVTKVKHALEAEGILQKEVS
jgi:hypothetical protein